MCSVFFIRNLKSRRGHLRPFLSSNPAVCQNWAAGGLSQWQCRDFDGVCSCNTSLNSHLFQDLVSGVPYKVNIYAIVEDSGIPIESKELHDKVSRLLPPSASLLDINPAGPVESKPLHEKVQLLPFFSPMHVKAYMYTCIQSQN